jgi:hypothetical protein
LLQKNKFKMAAKFKMATKTKFACETYKSFVFQKKNSGLFQWPMFYRKKFSKIRDDDAYIQHGDFFPIFY